MFKLTSILAILVYFFSRAQHLITSLIRRKPDFSGGTSCIRNTGGLNNELPLTEEEEGCTVREVKNLAWLTCQPSAGSFQKDNRGIVNMNVNW